MSILRNSLAALDYNYKLAIFSPFMLLLEITYAANLYLKKTLDKPHKYKMSSGIWMKDFPAGLTKSTLLGLY